MWSNGQWVNSSRDTYTYDAQENLTSVWFYSWQNSSWTPTDEGGEYFGFFVSDSAGNGYELGRGYNFNLLRNLIITGVASQSVSAPTSFSLSQNYPNPFNPSTMIRYELPRSSRVSLKVYNTLGQEVAGLVNDTRPAGVFTVQFDARRLASGVYYYRLLAGDFVSTKGMMILK